MAKTERISDKLTLAGVVQAFDKVKADYEVEGGELAIITEDRYDDVIEIMANHFTPDEPLCTAFGVIWHPEFEDIVRDLLKENISVMMVHKTTKDVMGVRISGVMKKDDVSVIDKMEYEPLKSLFVFLSQKEAEINFYNRFGIEEAFHFFSLGVNRNYRRMGMGTKLMGACIALARELGFKTIKGEGTSNFSQSIYQRYGFETLAELPYDTYTYKGESLRRRTGVHIKTKVFAKML